MEDDEEWEEEQLVLVELSGLLEHDLLFKASTEHCRLLGIETNEPVLQIGRYTFIGQYEDVMGTHVIFEEHVGDDENTNSFKYKGCANKSLKMVRAFLKETVAEEHVPEEVKSSNSSESGSNSSSDSSDDDGGGDDNNDDNNDDDNNDDGNNEDEDTSSSSQSDDGETQDKSG